MTTTHVAGERARIRRYVTSQVIRLQTGYMAGSSRSRADVSHLRRSIGKPLGADPAILPLVMDPTDDVSMLDVPTRAEGAILGALALYALHQQSETRPMHAEGVRFGTALSRIRSDGGNERQGVVRRFAGVMTANSLPEVLTKARGLIQLLKQADQPLDYGLFADDLYRLQSPYSADGVRLRWGRDFYQTTLTHDSGNEGDKK